MAVALVPMGLAPQAARAAAEDPEAAEGFRDPRRARLPRTHRLRIAAQTQFVEVSTAAQGSTTEAFRYIPFTLELAYQAQFLRRATVRPSAGFSINVANSRTAMPLLAQLGLDAGYQGRRFGATAGYTYFTPVLGAKDAVAPLRGGLGQPLMRNTHAVHGELSITSRVDRGALFFGVKFGGANGRVQHFSTDERRWFPFIAATFGWYFGPKKRR